MAADADDCHNRSGNRTRQNRMPRCVLRRAAAVHIPQAASAGPTLPRRRERQGTSRCAILAFLTSRDAVQCALQDFVARYRCRHSAPPETETHPGGRSEGAADVGLRLSVGKNWLISRAVLFSRFNRHFALIASARACYIFSRHDLRLGRRFVSIRHRPASTRQTDCC